MRYSRWLSLLRWGVTCSVFSSNSLLSFLSLSNVLNSPLQKGSFRSFRSHREKLRGETPVGQGTCLSVTRPVEFAIRRLTPVSSALQLEGGRKRRRKEKNRHASPFHPYSMLWKGKDASVCLSVYGLCADSWNHNEREMTLSKLDPRSLHSSLGKVGRTRQQKPPCASFQPERERSRCSISLYVSVMCGVVKSVCVLVFICFDQVWQTKNDGLLNYWIRCRRRWRDSP